jgi:hypothetical protein
MPMLRLICLSGLLLSTSFQQSTRIDYNQTVQGQLGEAHREDLWQFSGQAGDLILINMQSNNADNLDTYLTLSDDRGNMLLTDDDSGEGFNSRVGPFALPEDGTYEITAASYSGSGEYSLQLVNLRTRPYLTAGKPLVGLVDETLPAEYFLVRAPDDESRLYRVSVTDDESYSDPILSVYDLEGFISSTEYQTNSFIDPLVTMPDQTYVIVVSYNPSSRGAPYELSLTASEIALLQDGESQSGSIDYQHYTGQHYFHAESGDHIRLTITTTGGDIAPAIEVKSADFDYAIFTSEGKSLLETSVSFEIPASTVYGITVHDSSYEGGEGEYEVLVEWLDED